MANSFIVSCGSFLLSAVLTIIMFIAPAQEVLQSEVKVFTVGKPPLYPLTIYQGIGEETDRAWGELYNREPMPLLRLSTKQGFSLDTIFKIPRSQAELLPNKTYPLIDEPGYYVAELDVFHQLHCLVCLSALVVH
jgi:hypothetical protein